MKPITVVVIITAMMPLPALCQSVTGISTARGRTATSSVGEAGQRQTRGQMQGITPLARLSNRIDNRIQSRIRNRIDRDYQPDASGAAAFATAEERTRSTTPSL